MVGYWWDKQLDDFIPEEKAAKDILFMLCDLQEAERQWMLNYISTGTCKVLDMPLVVEIIRDCLPLYLEARKRVEEKLTKASLPKQVAANSGFAVTLARRTD